MKSTHSSAYVPPQVRRVVPVELESAVLAASMVDSTTVVTGGHELDPNNSSYDFSGSPFDQPFWETSW
ncbi:MAG: hypothetical protein J6M23_10020 [Bacteroidales bacterium]|nr:hypothetical protein [Bacteroidales bacterium]MBQ9194731.1 hypothetical protein [Bacteroidales bacterium]